MALPDVAKLVWRVARDDRVPMWVRGGLVGVAAYIVLPIDVVPDRLPLVGQLDDIVVLTVGGRMLLRQVSEPILREHWDGEEAMLEQLLGRKLAGGPAVA